MVDVPSRNIKFVCKCLGDLCMRIGDGHKPGARNTTELTSRLLHEAHVVAVPGEAFGTQEHIRLSYAVAQSVVDEGLVRMKSFFAGL